MSLAGDLRPVRGALAMGLALHRAAHTTRALVLPHASAQEAALVGGFAIHGANHRLEVVQAMLPGDAAWAADLPRAVAALQMSAPAVPDLESG